MDLFYIYQNFRCFWSFELCVLFFVKFVDPSRLWLFCNFTFARESAALMSKKLSAGANNQGGALLALLLCSPEYVFCIRVFQYPVAGARRVLSRRVRLKRCALLNVCAFAKLRELGPAFICSLHWCLTLGSPACSAERANEIGHDLLPAGFVRSLLPVRAGKIAYADVYAYFPLLICQSNTSRHLFPCGSG